MLQQKFEELKQSGSLPSPSGVGLVILRLTQNENCPLEDLIQCLQVDPALTGRLLKLANSPPLRSVVPLTTVRQAATRLGARGVRGLALSFTLVSTNRTGTCRAFDYDQYWSYSLACATAAQLVASERGLIDPAEAFTCALLSRIGLLALASVHPDACAEIFESHRGRSPTEVLTAESRMFDIHHWEVTAAMMSEWGLPKFYTEAVQALGAPMRDMSTEEPLTASMFMVLRDASRVAQRLVASMTNHEWALGRDWLDFLAPVGGQVRGPGGDLHPDPQRDEDHLRSLCALAAEPWHEWGGLFRIPTVSSKPPVAVESAGKSALAPGADPIDESVALPIGEVREEPPLAPGDVRVLVIDDDPRILRLLSFHLKQAGYDVLTAQNGEEGLQIALDRSPQIVVTDWIMPELSGIDLCRALRRIEAGRRTYVLILTAREDEQQVVDAFAAGADDYVTKPFNPRILISRVQAGQRFVDLQRQVEADKKLRMRQVAEMGLLTRKLRSAANTDVLTELPNRRYALMRLEQEWASSSRMNSRLSVVAVDIDDFKKINDKYGHDIGDFVLKSTAERLRAETRHGDVVCRMGGEEFLVINVNSDLRGAELCAERLRVAVEANRIRCEGYEGRVTVSLGCAERTPATRNLDDLLKAADEAVYAAKAAGRNAVRTTFRSLPEAG